MKQTLIMLTVVSLLLTSCGGKSKSEIELKFDDWAQKNMPSKYEINAITYDNVGSITDIIYTAYALMESKGGSTKAMDLFNKGCIQYIADCIADTLLPNTNIVIAKVNVTLTDGNKNYYIGMYKDSVVTQPFSEGMHALGAMPQKSLCLFIETLNVIFTNISEIMPPNHYTTEELAYKMLIDPNKPHAPEGFNEALFNGVGSAIRNAKKTI